MNKKSRTHNAIINIVTNFLYQCLIIFLTFLSRRVFIEKLGINFLGIGGLFSNLLEILSLAELGISGAISYSLYKEIACDNKEKIKSITGYYKSLYNKISVIVFVVGMCFLPFLNYVVNIENTVEYLELYYILNLVNMVASYLFVYKTSIVLADQNDYKLKFVGMITEIIKYICICVILIITQNYVVYLIVQIAFTLFNNIIRSYFSTRWYPFIKEKYTELDEKEKKNIWGNIKDMFCYKIGGVILNNTDNILTSVIVNTYTVGLYSNYMMIYNKINGFIWLIFSSITASIGNLNVSSTKDEKYNIFNIVNFVSNWLFLLASVGILYVGEDVILAMCGTGKFLLDKSILFVSILNFFVQGLLYPSSTFRQTSGLFRLSKYSMLICSFLNIVFSIIFGNMWGLFGIILATAFSRIITNVWYEPYILHKVIFEKPLIPYVKRQLQHILITIGIVIILAPIITPINIGNLYLRIFVKFCICFILSNIIMLALYKNNKDFKYFISRISYILDKLKSKKEI